MTTFSASQQDVLATLIDDLHRLADMGDDLTATAFRKRTLSLIEDLDADLRTSGAYTAGAHALAADISESYGQPAPDAKPAYVLPALTTGSRTRQPAPVSTALAITGSRAVPGQDEPKSQNPLAQFLRRY